MSTVSEILLTPLGIGLRLCAMLLLLAQVYLLLRAWMQKRSLSVLALYALHALLGLCLLTFLLDRAYTLDYLTYKRAFPAVVRWVGALPWAAVAGVEAVSVLLFVFSFRRIAAYAKSHPSTDSVKQTVDLLPTGICVAEQDGQILLSNLKMNACNRALTGSAYTDANTLWSAVQACAEEKDGKLLAHLQDGTVLQMNRDVLEQNGRQLVQISAEDVTEQYRMTAELAEKNARLLDIQRRLREYQRQQTALVIREELLAARTTVHKQLGGALLTGQYHLEHPDSTDSETLILLLRQINSYLLSEAEEPETGEDPYAGALQAAAGFGVTVAVNGALPPAGKLRTILSQAVVECAANAVKHAGGDRLELTVQTDSFTITNNGKPPSEEICPAGGLLSLKLTAEQVGGELTLQSAPVFSLTVTLPQKTE